MKRTIEAYLAEWKDRSGRKPLILLGARQVGKTYTVRAFGREHFSRVVVIDLEQRTDLHAVFRSDLRSDRIVSELEAAAGQRIIPGETLLFLDKIQACPRAIMALRYLYEQMPDLHVIAAGSLLEFSLATEPFPVGRVEFLWMHPLTFSEFLLATKRELIAGRRPHLSTVDPVPPALHRELTEALRQYFLVGGMPQAVEVYARTRSLIEVDRILSGIIEAYRSDMGKYSARLDRTCLEQVFSAIAGRIGQQIKYTALYPEQRVETIKSCLRVLEQAQVIRRVTAASGQGLPLSAQVSDKVFKMIFLDIGLLRSMAGIPSAEVLRARTLLDTYRGALAEQFVGQELSALGPAVFDEPRRAGNDRLYFWRRDGRGSSAEVDYLQEQQGVIIPLEVKSGPAGKLRSLKMYLDEHPQADHGLVLHDGEVSTAAGGTIRFFPLYTLLRHSTPSFDSVASLRTSLMATEGKP